jgi:hypothetical protein
MVYVDISKYRTANGKRTTDELIFFRAAMAKRVNIFLFGIRSYKDCNAFGKRG